MATLQYLLRNGELVSWEPHLERGEAHEREIYMRPALIDWIENVLPLAPKDRNKALSPEGQVVAIFDEYCRGMRMNVLDFKKIEKSSGRNKHVWEFRPTDARIFGYFYRPKQFVAVCAELKRNLQTNDKYTPFIQEVLTYRSQCQLSPPPFMTQDDVNELL